MNNYDFNNDSYGASTKKAPIKKKSSLGQPNIISVSLRFAILILLGALEFIVLRNVGRGGFGAREYILGSVIALPAVVILFRLLIWALKWVKDERVSELGLHIVRFAVILFAVMMGVFVMLSLDYTNQFRTNASTELTQQALCGRIYIQDAIGEKLSFNSKATGEIETALDNMLISGSDAAANIKRGCILYLFTDGNEVRYEHLSSGFDFIDREHTVIAAGSSASFAPTDDIDLLSEVRNSGIVRFVNSGSGEVTYFSAYSTVYTAAGRPVGVLEIRQSNSDLLNVFSFASLELFLRMAAYICLFSFGFYGVMQLLDIALRPRNFDKSRNVLSCGREAARPILFFVALTAALPLTLLLFSSSLRETVSIPALPEGIDNIAPAVIYALGIGLGYIAVRRTGARLTELPSNLALGVSAVCNIILILLLDWSLFPSLARYNNFVTILALIFVSGLCYGISFSTIKKYQKQSDRLFKYDKYAYLCSCLGAITGTILGAVVMDIKSDLSVRILMVIFSIAACVLSIILLEDLDTSEGSAYVRSGQSGTDIKVIIASVPVAAILAFDWVYVCDFLRSKGYGAASAAFCAVMPIIAFCFGNRLRLRSTGSKRAAVGVAAVLSAAAFVPVLISHSPAMAAASALLASFAVIFGAAALYSALCKEERSKFLGAFIPIVFVAMIIFSLLINGFYASHSLSGLIIASALCVIAAVLYMLLSVIADNKLRKAAKTTALAAYGADKIGGSLASVGDKPKKERSLGLFKADKGDKKDKKDKNVQPDASEQSDKPDKKAEKANKKAEKKDKKDKKDKSDKDSKGDNTDNKDKADITDNKDKADITDNKDNIGSTDKDKDKDDDLFAAFERPAPADDAAAEHDIGKNDSDKADEPIAAAPTEEKPLDEKPAPADHSTDVNDPLYTIPLDDSFYASPVFDKPVEVTPSPLDTPADDVMADDAPIIILPNDE